MAFPGVLKPQGRDFNFFQKLAVNWSTFGGNASDGKGCDLIIAFPTQSITFLNESASGVLEGSFNGQTVHFELDPTLPSRGLVFDNRVVSLIWFRVKAGSSGPITVSVTAWGKP